MDMETWKALFGKSGDDPAVKAALVAAGIKKIPRLDEGDTDVSFNLKGQGLWLVMTDESYLKDLNDQDIGEGPLILSGVGAYLDRPGSRDIYKGKLPYNIAAGMSRTEVRKLLGRPEPSKDDPPPFDLWVRDGIKVVTRYTDDARLATCSLMLPDAN